MKLIWSTTNLWQKLTHKRGYLYFKTKKYIAGATLDGPHHDIFVMMVINVRWWWWRVIGGNLFSTTYFKGLG